MELASRKENFDELENLYIKLAEEINNLKA